MNKEITVVIPAYNEEKSIEKTIKQVFIDVPDANVLVVDDGSYDNSREILKRLKKDYKRLKIIFHEKNSGYGGALKTAFKKSKTEYISFLDADMTYSPKYIPLLLSELKRKKLDCVWCNRFSGKNEMPLIRKVGNKALVILFFITTFRFVPDIASGERLFRRESLEIIDPNTLPNGLDMITAMSKRVVSRRLRYDIIKCDYMQRDGQSKLNIIMDFFRMSKNIIFEK